MGLEAQKDEAAARLIAAGRGLLARGEDKFPLTRLCAEAGVTLEDFRRNFASKAELLQQLMESRKPEPAQPDAWLERRLRVFERALSVLEERADRRERELSHAIARLEEKLTVLGAPQADRRLATRGLHGVEPEAAAAPVEAAPADPVPDAEDEKPVAVPEALQLAPLEPAPMDHDRDYLEAARQAALAHGRELEREARPRKRRVPVRWLSIAVLAAFALFVCAALTLIHAEPQPPSGAATAVRSAAGTPLAKLTARADGGDARAQAQLALAYLRGQGVAKDENAAARWADAAARRGDPEAQYLIGSLSRGDAARAFTWYRRGASLGNLKAMHNLAIAYLTGAGTTKDEAAAAAWFGRAAAGGYIDSAFDLGILYERGQGVRQDARIALYWYGVAAAAGDAEAVTRARTLRTDGGI